MVRTVDAVALEAFVTQIAVMREAKRELRNAPLLVKGSRGQPIRNPPGRRADHRPGGGAQVV